jgi:GNAT superfamily N-acetyltransferase
VDLLDAPDASIWSPMRPAAPSAADFAERQDIVSRITAPRVFARASLDGRPAASGMGVLTPDLSGDLLGLYLMRTAPDARRRGLASGIVGALLDWGTVRGAAMAYLQVEKSNRAAVTLYERAGFATAYSYWYWRLA